MTSVYFTSFFHKTGLKLYLNIQLINAVLHNFIVNAGLYIYTEMQPTN